MIPFFEGCVFYLRLIEFLCPFIPFFDFKLIIFNRIRLFLDYLHYGCESFIHTRIEYIDKGDQYPQLQIEYKFIFKSL